MKTINKIHYQKTVRPLGFLIVLLLFLTPSIIKAQHWMPLFEHLGNYYDIKAATEAYFMADTSRKSIKSYGYKDFNRWVTYMEPRVNQNGSLISYSKAYNAARNEILNSENYDRIFAEWESIGPIQNNANMPDPMSKLGLITSIWVDTSNYTTIYAGSNSGGLFVTYNAGQNWKCLTDKYMVTGIEDIAKSAKNPYEIYIGTGYYTWERNYGVGVLKSRDNGLSWQTTGLNNSSFQNEPDRGDINFVVPKIVQHPTDPDTLFALVNFDYIRGSKLMRTYDGGETWSSRVDLPAWVNTSMLFKIEMDPSDPATMYACGRKIIRTNNYWESYTDLTDLFVAPNERLERASISINPMNPDKILLIYHKVTTDGTDISTRDLLFSEDGGISFISILGTTDISLSNFYKMELEWSKVLENTFYMGGLIVQGYRILTGNIVEEIDLETGYHIDIREFKTYCKKTANPGGGYSFEGLIFQGNDGGITKGIEKTSTGVIWNDISGNGLNITQYYGIGIPKTNTELIIGGTQDGNYCRYESGDWTLPFDGDAADVVFNYNHPDSVYMVTFMTERYGMLSTDGGETWPSSNFIFINDSRLNDAPIEMSKTNPRRIYFGGKDVWKTTNGIDFYKISDFNSIGNCTTNVTLKTIREASNPNIIYAGLSAASWDDCDKRLFKTTNGGANNHWDDITPRIADLPGVPGCNLHNVGISDIAINPHNSNQIYLSVTKNVEGKKVFRYTDGEWINFSEGLPNVPVSCIKYFEHTNLNELFAGTDLGVYYRNDIINEWVPFGNGLPPMIVSDLEINYETNELVASTFGRGVYKVDLCFDPHEINSIYVQGTETWNDKIISNDVIITQGAVLTIVGTIGMLRSKHIYIQKGGLLILDGGKITNACKKELWGGVIVYGTSNGPQTLNYQGMINIRNNGTIENASVGIHCLNATNEEGGSVGTTKYTGGGIINADKAWFINNPIAVVFEKYTLGTASRFRLCNFVVNDELFADATFNYFVRMNEVNGVTFTGCSLKNEQTFSSNDKGYGIYSNNSFFTVDQHTSATLPPQKSIFNDLRYGVYAIGKKGGRTFSIQNADFNFNERGIFASGVDVLNIRNSHFFIKSQNPFVSVFKSGIYLDKCTGYIVEENDFHTTLSSPGLIDYGIFINSSGEANNTIYKNKFFDNKYGIAALDKNRNKDGSAGLMLKCNEFNNVKMDIVVMKTEPLSTGMGIASTQGTNGINCEYPAGNLFTNPYPPVTGYYSIHNAGESIIYTHHNMSSNNRVRPSVVTERTVTRVSTPHLYVETCCPSHSAGGGGTGSIDGNTLAYKSEAETTIQTLTTLIDDGDTGEKVMDVNSAAPAEALLMRNNLLQTSPYVSDTVLRTAINREELLNNAMLRDIMVANPHSAKSENLMQELDMRLEPMPENMKDEILEGVLVLSAKELMEAKRDMDMQFYNYGFNRLLSTSLTDTIPVPADTLMALLDADGSPNSLMQQAWILLENGDTTAALNRIASIASETALTDFELTELAEQQALMQWLATNPIIDSTAFEIMNNFLQSNSTHVSATARGIMVPHNLLVYNEPFLEPDLTKSMEINKQKTPESRKSEELIRVYPNPGRDFITMEYNLGDNNLVGSFEIVDQTGKIVKRGNLARKTDQIILDTRDLTIGYYYISLILGNQSVANARFVISK